MHAKNAFLVICINRDCFRKLFNMSQNKAKNPKPSYQRKSQLKSAKSKNQLISLGHHFWSLLFLVLMVATVSVLLVLFFKFTLQAGGYNADFKSDFPFFELDPKKTSDNPDIKAVAKLIVKVGPIGDYFGGLLNPIVALCALIGLLRSVSIQKDTLKATRKGLREQLDQENFFQLLENRENAIQNIEFSDREGNIFSGRGAIREILQYIDEEIKNGNFFYDDEVDEILSGYEVDFGDMELNEPQFYSLEQRISLFIVLYSTLIENSKNNWSLSTKKIAVLSQEKFSERYALNSIEDLLGHVFRATYQCLKFVYRSDLDLKKKRDLQNYLRAQMSEAEFTVFALTAITLIGAKSRAVAIAFNLYQNRLLSAGWAQPLSNFFDPKLEANYSFAASFDYIPLPLEFDKKTIIFENSKKQNEKLASIENI